MRRRAIPRDLRRRRVEFRLIGAHSAAVLGTCGKAPASPGQTRGRARSGQFALSLVFHVEPEHIQEFASCVRQNVTEARKDEGVSLQLP
jgi:hypothetical protein